MTIMQQYTTMDHIYNPDSSIEVLNPNLVAYVIEFEGGDTVAYPTLLHAKLVMGFGKPTGLYAILQGRKYPIAF